MLTFKNIQDQVLTFLDLAGDTGVGLDLVKYAINTAHAKRLSAERWNFMLWPRPISVTFTSGLQTFMLHPEVLMVTDFWNSTQNQQMMETPSRSRFNDGVQDDRNHFEFVNAAPVKRQPQTVAPVVVSGQLRIRYTNASDDVVTEDVTNASTAGSVKEILNVTRLLLTGTASITDSDGNILLSLVANEVGKNYPQIRLFDEAVGETGTYRFYRKPSVLVHDNDLPDIPFPFSNILIFDALLELATYNDAQPQAWWVRQQADWDTQMKQAYQEGEMEGSEIRKVRETDRYGG